MAPSELKAWRKAHGMTQEQLATALALTSTSIARMEQGKQAITERTLAALEMLARITAAPG